MTYLESKARRDDPCTSKEAAKEAVSDRSTKIRVMIRKTIRNERQEGLKGWTAREIAKHIRVDLPTVYRRLSEVSGIKRHPIYRRSRSSVWVAA